MFAAILSYVIEIENVKNFVAVGVDVCSGGGGDRFSYLKIVHKNISGSAEPYALLEFLIILS